MSQASNTQDEFGVDSDKEMQIGHVAERTSLSLRTIRYYEEEGLVVPAARTAGGFRLYSEADCERLQLIKQMKPLRFSLDEIRELLYVLDRLAAGTGHSDESALIGRLHDFAQISEERCERLRKQLVYSASFTEMLRERLTQTSIRKV